MNIVVCVSENNKLIVDLPPYLKEDNVELSKILSVSKLVADVGQFLLNIESVDSIVAVKLHTYFDEGEECPKFSNWKESKRDFYWRLDEYSYNYSVIRYEKKESPLLATVILSTCNQPEWLEKVLWGCSAQICKSFEVIVADDGSRVETYELVKNLKNQLDFPIKHVWHQDKGFRKCDILNKAILAAQTDYLIFTDGDCIPRKDFVWVHIEKRRIGRFLSHGYHKIDMDLSKAITKENILSGDCFHIKWLKEHGMPSSFKNNKLTAFGLKQIFFNKFTTTRPTWNGHGSSAWLADIFSVNGFDERMQYGGEDREFGERLENKGIRGMQIRYSTVCLHLDHSRGYKTKESIDKNLSIRKNTKRKHLKWTFYGIQKNYNVDD